MDVMDNLHDLDQFFVSGVVAMGAKGVAYLRYGRSAMWMPNGCLMSHPSMGIAQSIPNCPRIMERMTECYATKGSKSISTWIPFSQPRRGASPLMVIYAANSL